MSARHTMAIPADVQAVLRESRIEADRVVLPARQLDRTLYQGVIKVLGEYGGKWNRSAGAVLIKADARAKLVAALETGTVEREKVIRQAFYTPHKVAERLCQYADDAYEGARDCLAILEPSAGEGAIIAAAFSVFAKMHITAIEIDNDASRRLWPRFQDAHCPVIVRRLDFLQVDPIHTATVGRNFDMVLMNPPYQRGQAIAHVSHALRFVREGGVLGAIVPINFPSVVDGVRLESEELGAGAFKEAGTNINTKMIRCVR